MTPGTHGSTFGGNPLAMAVGNAVLDVIFEKDFLKNVEQKGEYFDQGLNKIKDKYPKIIGEIRGVGLIKGLKMLVDNDEFIKELGAEAFIFRTDAHGIFIMKHRV